MNLIDLVYNYLVGLLKANVVSIMAITSLVGLILFSSWVNKKLKDFIKFKLFAFIERFKDSFASGIDSTTIERIHEIHIELTELRIKLNADRCFVVEVHNGERFGSGDHIWKSSVSYESIKKGVSYIGKRWQNMLTNMMWNDFTRTLFEQTRDPLPEGMEYIKGKHQVCNNGCSYNKTTILVNTEDVKGESGILKLLLEDTGVSHMLYSPIFINGNLLGYIAAHYTNSDNFEELYNSEDFEPCLLCRYASHMATIWNSNMKEKGKMLQYQKKLITS